MLFETLCVLRAIAKKDGVDDEKKLFNWYQICLQSDDGLSVFTLGQEPDVKVGETVLAKFRNTKYDGVEKLKLVSLDKPDIS